MFIIRNFIIVGIVLFNALPVAAAPKVMVQHSVYDFGEVYQGENVTHDFQFSNQGDQPLLIEKVRSSCGCTAALATARELQPGESGEIKANFDSTRFRGSISKTIYLYTNDTAQPVVQLYIKGSVKEKVEVMPKQLSFGAVLSGKTVAKEVVLKNNGEQSLVIQSPRTTAPELIVVIENPEIEAGQTVPITVRLTPKPGQTRFSGYVLLHIEGVARNELRIPVYASIQK